MRMVHLGSEGMGTHTAHSWSFDSFDATRSHWYLPKVYTFSLHRWWCTPRLASGLARRRIKDTVFGVVKRNKQNKNKEVCDPPIRRMERIQSSDNNLFNCLEASPTQPDCGLEMLNGDGSPLRGESQLLKHCNQNKGVGAQDFPLQASLKWTTAHDSLAPCHAVTPGVSLVTSQSYHCVKLHPSSPLFTFG